MKAAKFCFDVYFAFFRSEILYAKYVGLSDKLKEVNKSQFFSTKWSQKMDLEPNKQKKMRIKTTENVYT
jgi:hypothetical protein